MERKYACEMFFSMDWYQPNFYIERMHAVIPFNLSLFSKNVTAECILWNSTQKQTKVSDLVFNISESAMFQIKALLNNTQGSVRISSGSFTSLKPKRGVGMCAN